MRRALQVILAVALAGVAFSGYLSYRELGGGAASCSAAGSGTLLGMPVCVYGLVMYVIVATVAALGLRGERHVREVRTA